MRTACLTTLGWLVSRAAAAQQQPPPDPTPPSLRPLLPKEGLLRGETWIDLGQRLLTRAVDYLPSLLAAILVLAFFLLASRLAIRLLRGMLAHTNTDPALRGLLLPLLRYTILGLGVIMALNQAGFEVGSLLAGLGVVGLAVGLAAQDTLGNVVAGFGILWDRPFRIGDRLTIGEVYGEVTRIGLRTTRLRTLEHLDVIFPNKEVVNRMIVNHTLSPRLRLGVPLSIAYREDTREARAVLLPVAATHPNVVDDPAPEMVVTGLADSGVTLELRVWLRQPDAERSTLFALLEAAKIALDEAGIEIPFPQRTLHVDPASPPLRIESLAERAGAERG